MALRILSAYFAHPVRSNPRPYVRIFAEIDRRRFEFVQLDRDSKVEAYDHPKAWHGIPRFVGYLPDEQARKLLWIARRAIAKVATHDGLGHTFEF